MKCPSHLLPEPELISYFEFSPSFGYESVRKSLQQYVPLLDDYYHEKGIANKVGYQTYFLPRELIKNAYHHGGGNINTVCFGIFLSPDAAVVGCCDGGDYFRNPVVKQMWEDKFPVLTKGRQDTPDGKFISGENMGRSFIYSFTDEIFIDADSGTFFGKFDPRIYLCSLDEILAIQDRRSLPKKKI